MMKGPDSFNWLSFVRGQSWHQTENVMTNYGWSWAGSGNIWQAATDGAPCTIYAQGNPGIGQNYKGLSMRYVDVNF